MTDPLDHLYELLPEVYRERDTHEGFPLRALLQVIAEQVNIVEADIEQLYENWFIETSQDWVVPYLGELIGYTPAVAQVAPADAAASAVWYPRREVAQHIGFQRRKGTLALLELLSFAVTGWQARAVEFFMLLAVTQALNHLRMARGQTLDLRGNEALARLNSPFDRAAHTVDVRRINTQRTRGLYNIPSVGLFVWRLKSYSITRVPAYLEEAFGTNCYSFSVLGNDTPLFVVPQDQDDPHALASDLNVPAPIRREALEHNLNAYYGVGKSFVVSRGRVDNIVPPEDVVIADLTDWHYEARGSEIIVDPALGRLKLPVAQADTPVWVTYHYGFSDALGGGEYPRRIPQPPGDYTLYRIGSREEFPTISAALARWQQDRRASVGRRRRSEAERAAPTAVLLVTDNGVYTEPLRIQLGEGEAVYLLAADGRRPVIRILDTAPGRSDSIHVRGETGSRFLLNGFVVSGRGITVQGGLEQLTIQHCTLVPGWSIDSECRPLHPSQVSLVLANTRARVFIHHSILGPIQVIQDNVAFDPVPVYLTDSIIDAMSSELKAIGPQIERHFAHIQLTMEQCTVLGRVWVHSILLAQDTLFRDEVRVARRQIGCMRFCYVPPGSRTPRRYRCQPETAVKQALADPANRTFSRDTITRQAQQRITPQFNSVRYGTPTYCQLALSGPPEIAEGAEDESEMGVFHDLYQPQRSAALRIRLEEYVPAGVDVGLVFVN